MSGPRKMGRLDRRNVVDPPLTADEEKALALLVRDGLAADPEDPADAGRIAAGREAEGRFFAANAGLVTWHADRITRWTAIEFEEAWQIAAQGVLEAIRRFDPDLGYKLSTYANCWVGHFRRSGVNEIRNRIRVPAHAMSLIHGRRRDGSDFSPKEARYAAAARAVTTFEVDNTEEAPREIIDPGDDAPLRLIRDETADAVRRALAALDPLERDLVAARFAFDCEPEPVVEVSRRHGVSRERGRRCCARAIVKLRLMLGRQDELLTA